VACARQLSRQPDQLVDVPPYQGRQGCRCPSSEAASRPEAGSGIPVGGPASATAGRYRFPWARPGFRGGPGTIASLRDGSTLPGLDPPMQLVDVEDEFRLGVRRLAAAHLVYRRMQILSHEALKCVARIPATADPAACSAAPPCQPSPAVGGFSPNSCQLSSSQPTSDWRPEARQRLVSPLDSWPSGHDPLDL
jgi:hypothetical protein